MHAKAGSALVLVAVRARRYRCISLSEMSWIKRLKRHGSNMAVFVMA